MTKPNAPQAPIDPRPPAGGWQRPGRAWLALALLLAAGALLARAWPPAALDWQPGLAWREPWRWWTAAWVHGSTLHLAANLAGAALVAALGVAARVPAGLALAWALAWPLTQLGWLAGPPLAHFGGLSGVLHAGVAVVALQLAWRGHGTRRAVGVLLLAGLLVKLAMEAPWGPALRHPPGWDIAIAPWSHASGTASGLLAAALVLACGRRR
jgi:rhomboid family GlyGly-CTERM serine protease